MSSYSSKRRERVQRDDSKAAQPSKDMDRVSFVGSIRSDMSTSALEKKLRDAQGRIQQLESVTEQQQQMIQRLMDLLQSKQ